MLRAAVALCASLSSGFAQQPRAEAEPNAPTVVLEGRVVDLRGEPVPAAQVVVSTKSVDDGVIARGVADGDGFFRLARVPKRASWIVFATGEGRCTSRTFLSGTPRPVLVSLHDAATVRGVLRNRSGQPVAKALVRAELDARILDGTLADALTDEEGRFTLHRVPLGPVRFAAVVPGEGLAVHTQTLDKEREIRLATDEGPTTSLRIVVKGLPADALAKLSASILPYQGGTLQQFPPPWDRPTFDASGVCELPNVPPYEYRVSPRAEGFAFAPRELTSKAGPHVMEFTASALGSSSLRVQARLLGPADKPLAGVPLVLRASNGGSRAEGTTDAEGHATLHSPLAAGTKVVVYATDERWVLDQEKGEGTSGAWDRRFLTEHECTIDATTILELRAVAACTVSGRLLQADKRPAAFVRVELEETRENRMPTWMTFAWATTDRDGYYHFRGRHHLDDAVRVKAEGPAGSAYSEPLAMAQPGTRVAVPDLALAAPAAIEGIVCDAEQRPAPGIRVWLRDWDMQKGAQRSGSVVEVITDRQGRYRFAGVPPGGAWLQLLAEAGERHPNDHAVAPFEVEAGKAYTHDLQLPAR